MIVFRLYSCRIPLQYSFLSVIKRGSSFIPTKLNEHQQSTLLEYASVSDSTQRGDKKKKRTSLEVNHSSFWDSLNLQVRYILFVSVALPEKRRLRRRGGRTTRVVNQLLKEEIRKARHAGEENQMLAESWLGYCGQTSPGVCWERNSWSFLEAKWKINTRLVAQSTKGHWFKLVEPFSFPLFSVCGITER